MDKGIYFENQIESLKRAQEILHNVFSWRTEVWEDESSQSGRETIDWNWMGKKKNSLNTAGSGKREKR